MANSVVCPEATIGDHVILLQCSTVNHHARVGDFATVSAGVTILGAADVGAGAFIGGGVSIAPYVRVGDHALVGMGSTVIRDVESNTVVAGNPARPLVSEQVCECVRMKLGAQLIVRPAQIEEGCVHSRAATRNSS